MKFKVTKTRLYKLASQYCALPVCKQTRFEKYRSSFWLYSIGFKAYLTYLLGDVILTVEINDVRKVYHLSLETLKKYDLVTENL